MPESKYSAKLNMHAFVLIFVESKGSLLIFTSFNLIKRTFSTLHLNFYY